VADTLRGRLQPLGAGTKGTAPRREYERRAPFGGAHGAMATPERLAPVVRFIGDDPQATSNWANGSEGERRLALDLRRVLGERAVLLHDRKVPGARGHVDHLAIAASGIWVIDAESDRGKVRGRDVGDSSLRDYRLYVGGRDRTRLIEQLAYQVKAVRSALGSSELPVRAALCFTDATWKLFARPSLFGDVCVTRPEALIRQIAAQGPLDKHDVLLVAIKLGETLTAAPIGPTFVA